MPGNLLITKDRGEAARNLLFAEGRGGKKDENLRGF